MVHRINKRERDLRRRLQARSLLRLEEALKEVLQVLVRERSVRGEMVVLLLRELGMYHRRLWVKNVLELLVAVMVVVVHGARQVRVHERRE